MAETDNITCEVLEDIATLSVNEKSGWTRELKIVRWNGGRAKYDIRDWSPDGEKKGRGLTFTAEEMNTILSAFDEEGAPDLSEI